MNEKYIKDKETGVLLHPKYGNIYHSQVCNDLKLPARVFMFIRDNITLINSGQGNITLQCPRLWGMTEEDFNIIFGVKK